jgi:arylsulfatase A-like enzyme
VTESGGLLGFLPSPMQFPAACAFMGAHLGEAMPHPRLSPVLLVPVLLCAGALAAQAQEKKQKPKQPNVVLMLVDNLGWGELGCYGGGELRGAPTPRLDKLASEGLRLLNFNVEPQCTPCRSAIMTGRHPVRSGTSKVVWGMLYGMTGWEKTVAELMSDAGYATGMFGKWHLGDTKGRFPTDQGFDTWFGIPNTTDEAMYSSQFGFDPKKSIVPHMMEAKKGKTPTKLGKYDVPARRKMDAEITRRASAFIGKQAKAGKPFFAFVPFTQPHMPTLPHPDFAGKTGNGHYADVLAEIDHRAGQILDAIDKAGVRDNTIVIWCSDNGPEAYYPWHGTAGPWRGTYFTALEGSLRTSCLVRWPGKVPAGSKNNEIVHVTDILPTLASAAGYTVPSDRPIDGVDQLPLLTGKTKTSAREGFPVFNGDDLYAYKWGNWKVHFVKLDNMRGIPQKTLMPRIHHLLKDPKEEHDMGAEAVWVLPVVLKKIVAFKRSLAKFPSVKLGTPDPYLPPWQKK